MGKRTTKKRRKKKPPKQNRNNNVRTQKSIRRTHNSNKSTNTKTTNKIQNNSIQRIQKNKFFTKQAFLHHPFAINFINNFLIWFCYA
ncbi:hypothetical protein DRJ25_03150 [Candidatus Woesearchaeota archaeon]|nr:MAG: hypothetical protein DRJ25_03150 [Candidatus Woesearchaeota archaeon]